MRRAVLLSAAVLAVSFPIAAAGRQGPAPAPAPTLGEVVLLSNTPGTASAAALGDALRRPDPAVRIAAGRVAAVVPHHQLRPALISALARERDPAAGAEFVRDILHLSNGGDLAFVEPQAKRMGSPAVFALAEWLARTKPALFAARLPDLTPLAGTDAAGLSELVTTATLQHPDDAQAIRRAWMTVAPGGGWDRVLWSAVDSHAFDAADTALVVEALAAPRDSVREETVWFVLRRLVVKQPVSREAVAAAAAPRDGAPAWEAFGRELIARGGKRPGGADRQAFIASEGRAHVPDLYAIQSAGMLTAAERSAVQGLVPLPGEPTLLWNEPFASMRTVPVFTNGVIRATLDAAKCQWGSRRATTATVTYAADGTASRVLVDSGGLSKACADAWSALARTAVADASEPALPDQSQILVLPLNASFLACGDADAAGEGPALSAPPLRETQITQPRKVKDVGPEYPQLAVSQRIQGVVVVEATVSRRGCVSHARLLRSIPPLDLPALSAVTAWEYTPTLLDGKAVPVQMTAIVNFRLP